MLSRGFAVLLSVFLLAGCTAAPAPAPAPTKSASGEVTADSVVGEVAVAIGAATAKVQVHPLVTVGEHYVLTLDVRVQEDPSEDLSAGVLDALEPAWSSATEDAAWTGLRLFSTFSESVVPPAADATGATVVARSALSGEGGGERIQLAYENVPVHEFALFVPQGGIVDEIPVLWDADPAADTANTIDMTAISSAIESPLVSYAVDLASATRTDADEARAIIALSADFLFEFNSAELNVDARAAIESAASQITQRQPGKVDVVGHTDADGDESYNQTLSEQRAAAVADVLATLIDTDAYPLAISGVGETKPTGANDTDDGRAQNRRVELMISTAPVGANEIVGTDEAPDTTGPVATGAEGVVIDGIRIRAVRAYTLDVRLVVELRIEMLEDAALDPKIFAGTLPGPSRLEKLNTLAGVVALDGSVAFRPSLYESAGAAPGTLLPLTDLNTASPLAKGDVRTATLIYPPASAIDKTATVQLLTSDNTGWRLTDIPVELEEGL